MRATPGGTYTPGRVIQRREVLHGQLWLNHPVTVVDDHEGVLAVLLEPGSIFTSAEHPFGRHPWSVYEAWSGPTVLQLHRDGDPYSVWKFFTDGVFTHWYINVEAPIVRHRDGTGGGAGLSGAGDVARCCPPGPEKVSVVDAVIGGEPAPAVQALGITAG